MPTYEYECPNRACMHRFEHFQSISSPFLTDCPACGYNPIVRLIGAGLPPIFKGSGFFSTDYGKKEGQSNGKASS